MKNITNEGIEDLSKIQKLNRRRIKAYRKINIISINHTEVPRTEIKRSNVNRITINNVNAKNSSKMNLTVFSSL